MNRKNDLTAEQVREVLDYDPETGALRWKERSDMRSQWNGRYAGKPAGGIRPDGYLTVCVNYRHMLAHRVAWLHFYGEYPPEHLDHINQCKTDNRIANLREATRSQNQRNRGAARNNALGIKGVHWVKERDKYCAQIQVEGKNRNLGHYETAEEAYAVYCRAAEKLHGEFANVGAA
jgi:hypothetical protein